MDIEKGARVMCERPLVKLSYDSDLFKVVDKMLFWESLAVTMLHRFEIPNSLERMRQEVDRHHHRRPAGRKDRMLAFRPLKTASLRPRSWT